MDYYVISVKHTQREHKYITVWRTDNCGYCWPLSWAGKYPESLVMSKLSYYNDGGNVIVPCDALDSIAVPPLVGEIDNNAGPCVLNNRPNWQKILASVPVPPTYDARPEYKGARRRRLPRTEE
jgi:hypothetical protein